MTSPKMRRGAHLHENACIPIGIKTRAGGPYPRVRDQVLELVKYHWEPSAFVKMIACNAVMLLLLKQERAMAIFETKGTADDEP